MDWTWDLSFLYKGFDDPAFAADLAALPQAIGRVRGELARQADDRTRLENLVDGTTKVGEIMERLMSYCELTLACDATNALAAQYDDKLSVLGNELQLLDSAITRYVGSVDGLDKVIASSSKLTEVAFALREMADNAHHLIPENIEPWLLQMRLSGGTAFSQLRDKLDSTHTVDFRGKSLPLPAVRGMAYDPDASVRKDAYEAEIASYKKLELPMSFCLNSIKMEARTLARARGFDSVLDMTLHSSRMDRETLDAMFTAIREYLPDFRRYLRAKASVLGHQDGLPFYDLFAPVGKGCRTFTVEQAREKLIAEMGKFTPDMAAFIDHAFEARWIDMFPRKARRAERSARACISTTAAA